MEANIKKILREDKIIVSATEPTGSDRKKVWLQHSKNSFDESRRTTTSLSIVYYPIEVKPNTDYTLSTNTGTSGNASVFLTLQSSGASSASNGAYTNNPRTVNSGSTTTMYVGCRTDLTNAWVMLNVGSTATPYEPYVEPKIYVLNDNNIYEEFVQKEQNNYSTEEQVIGKWLGKPLYRKVIDVGTLPNTNTKSVEHDIVNISHFTFISGIAYANSKGAMPLPYTNATLGNIVTISADATNIHIATGMDRSIYHGYVILEYTKTTD